MTIPQARQQVATHPAKDAVTAPVVKENKDADVARKLKLYGVRPFFAACRVTSPWSQFD